MRCSMKIRYDGDGVDGLMDVRELAPALLAIGDLISETDKIINGKDSQLKTYICATKHGSFEISFEVGRTILENVQTALGIVKNTEAYQLLEVIGVIGIAPATVIGIYKFLHGNKPDKVEKNGDVMTITSDNRKYEITQNVYNVFSNFNVRKAIEAIVSPLGNSGIDGIAFAGQDGRDVNYVTKDEQVYFEAGKFEEEISNFTSTMMAVAIDASLDKKHKWQFSNGESRFNAFITDDDFWKKVERDGLKLQKDGYYQIEVKTIQRFVNGVLKAEHEIVRVLKYFEKPDQLKLF